MDFSLSSHRYLTVLHPYFPILAANKSRLEAQLARCTPVLREAFITAFHGAIESFPSFNNGNSTTEARSKATRLLAEYDEMNIQRPYVAQLVKLQTLILIVILLDNGIPSPFPGGNGDTSLRYTGLGLAVAQAYQMRLHSSLISDFIGPGVDSDSDENVAIRTWWALIMLDRWHAISLATPKFIPNDMVVILPGLQHLIGESAYHFVRLSNILGHFALVALKSPHTMSFQPDSRPLLDSFFSLSMDLFRELLPATVTPATHPFLHIVYWHCRLLSYTLQTNARSSDILWCCDKLVDLLIGNSQMLNPLNHHFFCITALCLLELNKTDCEREAAGLLLKKLNENQVAPSNWDNIIRDRLAEAVRPSTVHAMEAAASQGLQHLADLATAAEMDTSVKPEKPADTTLGTGNSENTRFSLLPLAQTGYLNALLNSIPNAAV